MNVWNIITIICLVILFGGAIIYGACEVYGHKIYECCDKTS